MSNNTYLWLCCLCFALLIFSGCSFQSHQPAPVDSVTSAQPRYDRGSLTANTYKVKKGDTLYSISWGASKDFIDVAKINNLRKPYIIYPGQVLKLSGQVSTPTSVKKNTKPSTSSVKTASKTTPSNANSIANQQVAKNSQSSVTKNDSTKKELDQKAKPAYSVTTTQQKVNQTVSKPVSTLPSKVKSWQWPVKGKLIGRFSASQQGNQGIKIAGNRGDLVKAAADGRVVYAGNALRGYGNLVIIKHNDDYLSAYAHADKILVKEKQYVNAGQTVATMGSTGASNVMLHFEIRYHGKSVDPLKYLPRQ
ncbi:peptidoglycan DD-metalloendopeptidase family protein [Shewanella maritima]|uniref:peptidoglycan DD-metalloendopeptidase family protein n=1 Tax=Shewanella maritima TaxID=2520507 RepID=UPI0037352DA1